MTHRTFAVKAVLAAMLLLCGGAVAQPLSGAGGSDRKVQVELLSNVEAVVPGRPFEVGLRQTITPNWHTYWKNPGDSGEPTRIAWRLPGGFTVSDIAWPIPDAMPLGPLTNYGYSDQVLLPVTVTPPADLSAADVTLTAKATWLVCEKICIPEEATLSLTLPVAAAGQEVEPSRHAAAFDAARRAQPQPIGWPVSVTAAEDLVLRVASAELDPSRIANVHFFPDTWGVVDHAAEQRAVWNDEGLALHLKRGEDAQGDKARDLSGVLVITERIDGEDVRNGFSIATNPKSPPTAPSTDAVGEQGEQGEQGFGLWQAILFAVLGGLILNAMPCVLPILSLKVMALARHGGRAAVPSGLAYLMGVLVSFAALAAVLIALKAAGESLGWGFQFQSPVFVLAMAALFFALGLSMSGVFHIGGSVVGLGDPLTRQRGLSGSFFTGVLATVAATPCTAPFMGAAIGYALTRSDLEILLVLLALGGGFALPVLVLSVTDAARRLLPKPGAWMETLKQVLAFPLYATVVWLVWVLSVQAGSDGVLAAGIVLIGVGLAAWIIGRQTTTLLVRSALAAVVGIVVLASVAGLVPGMSSSEARSTRVDMTDADMFSEAAVDRLRREGRPVFVNLTAAWCISCKVNERVALQTDGFRQALAKYDIAYLKGDWTNRNEEIGRVLKAFGRAGVPLYVLFPADVTAEPVVLPQILTEAIVVRHFAALSETDPR